MTTKLGVISTPQPGDLVQIITKDGKDLHAQVMNWGLEAWGEMWSVCRIDNQIVQINLSNISIFTLQKQSSVPHDYKLVSHNKDTGNDEERIITAQKDQPNNFLIKKKDKDENIAVKIAAPVFNRRLVTTSKAVVEEGLGPNHHLSMDPIERARLLAEQQHKRAEVTRRTVHDHMVRKDIENVKHDYSMPSFKKRSKS